MNLNVGGADRAARIVLGLALVFWALTGGSVWAWAGVISLVTGLVRFCPLYALVGIKSCKLD